jgi:glycosyltransferase involved in cell wall biosynthesis
MAKRLKGYGSHARTATLPPWGIVESVAPARIDPVLRKEMFGDAQIGLLYSGNFGRAHSCDDLLNLARRLRGESIRFCFGVRGNRVDELRNAITSDDGNISWAGFAPETELEKRLGACDIHLVSLREEWTGTVVPSKFFGALAAGRSVLYSGSRDSAVARWIEEHRVGWVLTPENASDVADELRELARKPERLQAMNERCLRVYREHFARERIIDRWDAELRDLMSLTPMPGLNRSAKFLV